MIGWRPIGVSTVSKLLTRTVAPQHPRETPQRSARLASGARVRDARTTRRERRAAAARDARGGDATPMCSRRARVVEELSAIVAAQRARRERRGGDGARGTMRAKTFSRLALALALASLASYANAANECYAHSSGRIRAQGFGLPQTQDLIEWYEGSSITVKDGDKVTGWTSTVAYDDGTTKGCFSSQVETHNNYLLNARKKSVSGHGATKAVNVMAGDTTVNAFFSGGRYVSGTYTDVRPAFKTTWTFCTLARYSGANKGRIFKGTANMFHGFHGGRRGVCYYNGAGNCGDGVGGTDTDWLIMCTHNGVDKNFVVGSGSTRVMAASKMTSAVGETYYNVYYGINHAKGCNGNQCSREKSDFEVAEILVWQRQLTGDEMMKVYDHLYLDILGYHSPPSPPPSPPPPPPPSPPPPGSSMPPVVTISNAPNIVTSYKFNFGVKVAHDSCEGHESDCFDSEVDVDEVMNDVGLKCDASVRSEGADCSSGDGEFLPCMQWNNFSPREIPMTDEHGMLAEGTHKIAYRCYFKLEDGSTVPHTDVTEVLHEFVVKHGCDDVMPAGTAGSAADTNYEVAKYLLLTSDILSNVECTEEAIYDAKEAIFRRHDNDPEDGVLSYDEIVAAAISQSSDTFVLDRWNEISGGTLELHPSQMLRVDIDPLHCGDSDKGILSYTEVVYPTANPKVGETSATDCAKDAAVVKAKWTYGSDLAFQTGDYLCSYIDGILYDKFVMHSSSSDSLPEGYAPLSNQPGLSALHEINDVRPVAGSALDSQQTLEAYFLFSQPNSSDLIASLSTSSQGFTKTVPTLKAVNQARNIGACEGGSGGACLLAADASGNFEYEYAGEPLLDDVGFSAWIYVPCGALASTPDDAKRASIAYFAGEYANRSQILNFFLRRRSSDTSSFDVVATFESGDTSENREISIVDAVRCEQFSYVGFALNYARGMLLRADDKSEVDSAWSVDSLKYTKTLRMFGANEVEYDDVRVYSGTVSAGTFDDAFSCGHRSACTPRALATPASRRVVCSVAVTQNGDESSRTNYVCATGMYYDGSAIDITMKMDLSGVNFAFRDTSWNENSFEILRRTASTSSATSTFDTVIIISSGLKGCASNFASITYVDRDAGAEPNLEWHYKVRTKTSSGDDFVSLARYFKSPWIGTFEGDVTAGSSQVGVPYIRVCANFASLASPAVENGYKTNNLALNMRATISNDIAKTATEKAYVITNGDASGDEGSVRVSTDDYVRVELADWSSVETVKVCGKFGSSTRPALTAYVQDYDAGDSVNYGNVCEFSATQNAGSPSSQSCYHYDCRGTHLASFHGQYVAVEFAEPAEVTEIAAYGSKTACKFSTVTDDSGEFILALTDTSGTIAKKPQVLIGVYKAEVSQTTENMLINASLTGDPSDVRPEDVLLVVRETQSESSTQQPSESSSVATSFAQVDVDESGDVSMDEFVTFAATVVGFPTKGHAVVSDAIWRSWDTDGTGELDKNEFQGVASKMVSGALVAEPIVVYPPINVTYDFAFKTTRTSAKCENFVLARQASSILPRNNTGWSEFYSNLVAIGADPIELVQGCGDSIVDAFDRGDAQLRVVAPMLAAPVGAKSISLAVWQSSDETDVLRRFLSINDASNNGLKLVSSNRPFDVVHVFNQKEDEQDVPGDDEDLSHAFTETASMRVEKLRMSYKSSMNQLFTDDTMTYVKGAVLFPKNRVAGSTRCGLEEATITLTDSAGASNNYTTDESGWFEIAVTRGKTFTFEAHFPSHTLCYAGRTIADAAGTEYCAEKPLSVTLNQVVDDSFIFFADVTEGNVDLGLYHGDCEDTYTGAKFKITPVNGCHAPVYVTSEEVDGWQSEVKGVPDAVDPVPRTARVWPFAAMDYSIMLDSGPDGSVVDAIRDEPWYDQDACQTEDGSILTYFRRRNTLERLALMRNDNLWSQIRYRYHGYICAYISNIAKISNDQDVCLGDNDGQLKAEHFLGETSVQDVLGWHDSTKQSFNMNLQVFEIHAVAGGYKKCFKLPGNDGNEGSTLAKVRQDVTEAGNNPCHPNSGGGPGCDFQVELTDEDYGNVDLPPESAVVNRGLPNLAGNHRRQVSVQVARNDGYRTVTATTTRNLISLGSKQRGGDGLSDATFWATVPLDGLVYTVVHDPPGGDSYAELSSGSTVSIEYTLAKTRAGGNTMDFKLGLYYKTGAESTTGVSVGMGAEVQSSNTAVAKVFDETTQITDFEVPSLKVRSRTRDAWDMSLTTERVIRSSDDPALPGRPGSTILGGGIELVYELSDVLDLTGKDAAGSANSHCLEAFVETTWSARKPTSYALTVQSIEKQIMPNLQFLLRANEAKGDYEWNNTLDWKRYIQGRIDAWSRTLEWSMPTSGAPYIGDSSVFQHNIDAKFGHYDDEYEAKWTGGSSGVLSDLQREWAEASALDLKANGIINFNINAAVVAFKAARQFTPASIFGTVFTAFTSLAATRLLGPSNYLSIGEGMFGVLDTASEDEYQGGMWNYLRKDDLEPDYDTLLKHDADEVYYSFGMSNEAVNSMESAGFDSSKIGELDTDGAERYISPTDNTRIMASLMGGQGPTGFDDSSGEVLLTFSGGGAALDFSFSSNEVLHDEAYEVDLGIEGGVKTTSDSHWDTEVTAIAFTNVMHLKGPDIDGHYHREFGRERAFMWNKRGLLTSHYTLGDPEYGDKFVVSVSSDARFGTPLFITKGGRSLCPAESGTVFRESGVTLELASRRSMESLNPGERAIFSVVIRNESPYREARPYSLHLVDGLASSLDAIVDAAYAAAAEPGATSTSVNDAVILAAGKSIARGSPEVTSVTKAASDAAGGGQPAMEVANAAYKARSTAAPYQDKAMGDSMFSINKNKLSLGDYMPFKFVGGDALGRQQFIAQQYLDVAVNPGFATRNIEYVQLRVQSLCETQIWEQDNLYRDPIGFSLNVEEMSWLQRCPRVQFDETTIAGYSSSRVSKSSDLVLPLVVVNPNPDVLWPDATNATNPSMNTNLDKVRLQYRPVTGGEWITAKSEDGRFKNDNYKFNFLCEDSRTVGCKFDWNLNNAYDKLLSGFKDGAYELRLKSFCINAPTLADISVQEYVSDTTLVLFVDTKAPMERARTASGETFFNVAFTEEIDCGAQTLSVTKVNSMCDGAQATATNDPVSAEQVQSSYSVTCVSNAGAGTWVVGFPDDATGLYRITVDGITDLAGNPAKTIVDNVQVRCAPSPPVARLGARGGARAPVVARANPVAIDLRGVAITALIAIALFIVHGRRSQFSRIHVALESDAIVQPASSASPPSYGAAAI